MVKNSPSCIEGAGLIPGRGTKILHASWPKNHNIKQKQFCNKFKKDLKNGPHKHKQRRFCSFCFCTLREDSQNAWHLTILDHLAMRKFRLTTWRGSQETWQMRCHWLASPAKYQFASCVSEPSWKITPHGAESHRPCQEVVKIKNHMQVFQFSM